MWASGKVASGDREAARRRRLAEIDAELTKLRNQFDGILNSLSRNQGAEDSRPSQPSGRRSASA